MLGPKHLWRGDWRADSESAREAAARNRTALWRGSNEDSAQTEALETPTPSSRRTFWARRLVAAALALGIIAIAAVALDGFLTDGGGAPDSEPAAQSKPLERRPGETRAAAVYRAASPAVVSIRTAGGSGTGFVIDRAGTIVTNSHVARSSKTVTVRFGKDSDSIRGDVLGTDPSSDLAVVGIDSADMPAAATPLALADSSTVRVGDLAIAIGNPFGLDRTATQGIVSAVGREIQAPDGFSIDSAIQTDAPINPGNSGGPLLNDSGQVIGVNSQIRTAGSAGNVGIGFAVPSNTVRKVVPVLSRGDTVDRAYLGVQTSPASAARNSGALVQDVVPDGPAERAGVRTGDIVIGVDGLTVGDPSDIAAAIADKKPGDEVEVKVQRSGRTMTLRATLGKRPGATP
jgi:putative serine protease PepD